MSKSIERFRELTMLDGTSGFESEISKYLEENLSKYADEIKFDNLGGIYAIKKSKKDQKNAIYSINLQLIYYPLKQYILQ